MDKKIWAILAAGSATLLLNGCGKPPEKNVDPDTKFYRMYTEAKELNRKLGKTSDDLKKEEGLWRTLIEFEHNKGNYYTEIGNRFNLANVVRNLESRSTKGYARSIQEYENLIKLAEKTGERTYLIDDAFLNIGNMCTDESIENPTFDIHKGVNAYLNGILQNGDMWKPIIRSIIRGTNYDRHKEEYRAALMDYVKKNPNSLKQIRDIFVKYRNEVQSKNIREEVDKLNYLIEGLPTPPNFERREKKDFDTLKGRTALVLSQYANR